jgi:hypothetical protein
MTKTYKPFKLLETGEKFIDLDTGVLCMKIGGIDNQGNAMHLSAGYDIFHRTKIGAVALQPFKAHGRDYPVGAVLAFDEKEAVEIPPFLDFKAVEQLQTQG